MERVGVRELDLRKCGPGSVAERVGFVPGLRSSAAFFTCLRANLVLSPSALASNYNTPHLEPCAAQPAPIQPPPCSTIVFEPLVPLDDIPPLSLDALTHQDDKVEGLRLVADSVSAMAPQATKAVMLHPLCLVGMSSSWAVIFHFVYAVDIERDASRALMLASGITMLYIAAVRFITSGYSHLADKINESWLRPLYGGEEDVVLGARIGSLLVGTLVLRLEPKRNPNTSPNKRKNRSRSASLKGGKGVIRAWTTLSSHRGQGIGKGLLSEAVRYTRERCGKEAQVGFAQEHANSVMILPDLFNHSFRMSEVRAAKALNGAVEELDVNKRKR